MRTPAPPLQADTNTGLGHQNINLMVMGEQPTACPTVTADRFAFSGSANCADRSATVIVPVDESWYDCSNPDGTLMYLWVHVAASSKVRLRAGGRAAAACVCEGGGGT